MLNAYRPSRAICAPRLASSALTVLATVALGRTAGADVITVPGDFPTVAAAVAAAVSGDEIQIAAGNYPAIDVDPLGKDLTITGAGANSTTLDAQFTGRHFLLENGETSAFVFEDIRFRRGRSATGGGSLRIDGASPTIRDCRFNDNQTTAGNQSGGAIYLSESSSSITDCTFNNNHTAPGASGSQNGGRGGALFVRRSSATIEDCDFTNNSTGDGASGGAATGGEGGAGGAIAVVSNDGAATATVLSGCTFDQNSTGAGGVGTSAQGGGGDGGCVDAVVRGEDSLLIDSCILRDGATGFGVAGEPGRGGGLYLEISGGVGVGPQIEVVNTVVEGCSTPGGGTGGFAGGIGANPTVGSIAITNSTISNCSAGFTGQGIMAFQPGTTVRNSIVWNCGSNPVDGISGAANPTVTYSVVEGGLAGTGNLDQDPLLENDGVHLKAVFSPCVDAGDPSLVGAPTTDIDGDPRGVSNPIDIGADEVQKVVNVPSLVAPTLEVALDVVLDGGCILVAPGVYLEHDLFFSGTSLEIVGEAGSSTTTINAQGAGRILRFEGPGTITLEGLTLRNGDANSGAAVSTLDVDLVLRDCVFLDNDAELQDGGAIHSLGSGTIDATDCRFEGNSAFLEGGAVYCWSSGSVTSSFQRCVFLNSTTNSFGGAVSLGGPDLDAVFERCHFEGCSSQFAGAIRLNGTDLTLQNCTVRECFDTDAGASVIYWGPAASQITIDSSILREDLVQATPILNNPGGHTIRYSNMEGGPAGTDGNIDEDPLFAASTGYALSPTSPCVDTGDPALVAADFVDLDGDASCTRIDMGADEFASPGTATIRNSLGVPNPEAFTSTADPTVGETWIGILNHVGFVPGALADFVFVSLNALDIPLGPGGSLLVGPDLPYIGVITPSIVTPILLPIPDKCAFLGLPLYVQAGSIDTDGTAFLTNALDLVPGE